MTARLDLDTVRFDDVTGTVVVVAQEALSGKVLMVAHADREALERTIETREMNYRSRSRGLWHKGATSGNVQRVVSLTLDCDGDTILARVLSAGPACHAGTESCFNESSGGPNVFSVLSAVIDQRRRALNELNAGIAALSESATPAPDRPSYTQQLLRDRNLRLKKIGEEAAELIAACADGNAPRAAQEAADLIYHVAVALAAARSSLDAVAAILFERSKDGR